MMELKQQGKTIFLNSHLLQEVEMVCDRVAILDLGVLRFVGTVKDLARPQLRGMELDMKLSGPEEAILAAVGLDAATNLEPCPDQIFQVRIRIVDQDAADRCVDRLRQSGISIVSLTPRRISLEDGFMDLLAQPTIV